MSGPAFWVTLAEMVDRAERARRAKDGARRRERLRISAVSRSERPGPRVCNG